jgi:hypothetical protein
MTLAPQAAPLTATSVRSRVCILLQHYKTPSAGKGVTLYESDARFYRVSSIVEVS